MNNKGFGKIHLIQNNNKHRLADDSYIYFRLVVPDGKFEDLMLTTEEFNAAKYRAKQNVDDIPKTSYWTKFWDWMMK